MRHIARILFGLQLAGMMVLLTGCWDLMELNKTALITGIALEPGEGDKIRVTIETLNASEAQQQKSGKGAAPSIVSSLEMNTIAEAAGRFNESLDRTMILSHIRVIIIDERLARKGMDHYLDALQRTRYVREDVLVLISKDVAASDILKVLYPRGGLSSLKIKSQVEGYYRSWGGIEDSRLFDLSQSILAHGRETLLGAVTVAGIPAKAFGMESVKSSTPKAIVRIAGGAVLRKDKLKGFLTNEETRMILMARNRVHQTVFSVPLQNEGYYAAIRVLHMVAKRNVSFEQGKLNIRLSLTGEGLVGSIDQDEMLKKVSGFKTLEELASKYVQKEMSRAIQTTQQDLGLDVIGFGEELYRKHYKQYQEALKEASWNELFSQTPVTVDVHIKLLRSELKTEHMHQEGND
ncbi:Ger(x)C family spore germination protein [Paenibacillus hexagrammi]|uniref:Ger(X)C family spore germination protein n=1 Tax=Paenibacillus hexagrammi TaxID=2908839 RepID=A0ABY3SIU2_9BACL|nr:Ger(x)C family spore germination protein [Paenibacillus sp. YPD9-1]UJF33959.1 Ger(x)C family spore germination protein [Paenibacillus sp. YPD9-1]